MREYLKWRTLSNSKLIIEGFCPDKFQKYFEKSKLGRTEEFNIIYQYYIKI